MTRNPKTAGATFPAAPASDPAADVPVSAAGRRRLEASGSSLTAAGAPRFPGRDAPAQTSPAAPVNSTGGAAGDTDPSPGPVGDGGGAAAERTDASAAAAGNGLRGKDFRDAVKRAQSAQHAEQRSARGRWPRKDAKTTYRPGMGRRTPGGGA